MLVLHSRGRTPWTLLRVLSLGNFILTFASLWICSISAVRVVTSKLLMRFYLPVIAMLSFIFQCIASHGSVSLLCNAVSVAYINLHLHLIYSSESWSLKLEAAGCGSMPEPYLWWVHQTGTVYVRQSASCELWLWLVLLDWHSHYTHCHLLTQMLRTWLGLPELEIPDFLIARIYFIFLRFHIGFLISGLSAYYASRKVLRKHPVYSSQEYPVPPLIEFTWSSRYSH